MLQQTRVETVIPYYQRWVQRFPDVHALADAPIDDVVKQWEGLGYYSRARNLQRAAQMVREHHDGHVPASYSALRALPGVGAYTAAAVASIAFAQPHAAVDGNVRRVVFRLLDLKDASATDLQNYADLLLDAQRPGDFNQAMMELGATVCTPRSPACSSCPVQRLCRACHNGTVALRPTRKTKAAIPLERVHTLVAVHDHCVLIVRRPLRGLLAGLWEYPVITNTAGFHHIGALTHTFTHKRIEYNVFTTTARVELPGRWIAVAELPKLAFSTAQRRVAKLAFPFFGL